MTEETSAEQEPNVQQMLVAIAALDKLTIVVDVYQPARGLAADVLGPCSL